MQLPTSDSDTTPRPDCRTTNVANSMTHDEANLALDATMDAHTEMFGYGLGIPFPYGLVKWVQALQEAVAAGKPVDPEPFFPSDPNVDA